MKRTYKSILMLVVMTGAAALIINATAWLIDVPRDRVERSVQSIGRHLGRDERLVGLLTFDEAIPREWVSDAVVLAPGTICKPARFGSGRAFDGRERTHIDTSLRWRDLGNRYTLAMWVMLRAKPSSQDLFYGSGSSARTGFRLQSGHLTFDVPGKTRQVVSYPFKQFDKEVLIVATVDEKAGTMMLYENGNLMASNKVHEVRWGHHNISFGKPVWYASQHPFHGVLDEAALLKGVMPPDEIRRLARAHHGFLRHFTGSRRYFRWRIALKRRDAAEFSYNLISALTLPLRRFFQNDRPHRALPTLGLHLTGQDMRYFLGAHQRSRLSGRRIQAGARSRRIHLSQDGCVSEAQLHLGGSNITYPESPRPSFVLELPDSAPCFGTTRLYLQPPESNGYLAGFLLYRLRQRFGLPAVTNGFCHLKVNGNDLGNYIFTDYATHGVALGDDPDIASGNVRSANNFGSLFNAAASNRLERALYGRVWPLTADELLALHDEVAAEIEPLITQDPLYPYGLTLLKREFRLNRQQVTEAWATVSPELPLAQRWAEFIHPFQILGDNLSPERITEALNLKLPDYSGVELSWRSSHPEIIDPVSGAVRRPNGRKPAHVQLTANVDDGQCQADKTFSLRVMPARIALPSLFLYMEDLVVKTRRIEATIDICEPGEDHPSRRLRATQGRRGGINHRGNTSYWSPKKLFTLKFDEPHGLFGDTKRRTVVTINGLQDHLFLNNTIAFDLFREIGTPAEPRYAPHVRHAEFYVNGYYQGLYELCTRLDEDLVPSPGLIVYRHENVRPRQPPLRAARPPRRDGDFMQPFLDLQQVVEETPSADWLHQVGQNIDLVNVIDYQLLLNFLQNSNGAPFPFWFHDALLYQPSQKPPFSHVPWDFDIGFVPLPWGWIENDLMRRLAADMPDYQQQCARRWQLWRKNVLSEAALEQRMLELSRKLAPFIEHDHRRWQYGDPDKVEAALKDKRRLARRNLHAMDSYLKP